MFATTRATAFVGVMALVIPMGSFVLTPPAADAADGQIDPRTGDASMSVWIDHPLAATQLRNVKDSLQLFSHTICDATEGQFKLKTIRLTSSASERDRAAFRFIAHLGNWSGAYTTCRGFDRAFCAGVHRGDSIYSPDVQAHEFGHLAFALGEQYESQRPDPRYQFCGLGPGFDPGAITERSHSIMQQGGRSDCLGGPRAGKLCRFDFQCGQGGVCRASGVFYCVGGPQPRHRCLRDSECGGGHCRPIYMSEFSTRQNHDLVRGSGTCAVPRASTTMTLAGYLSSVPAPSPLDRSSFSRAKATAAFYNTVDLYDSAGGAQTIHLYAASRDLGQGLVRWVVSAAIDEGIVSGGRRDRIKFLQDWVLAPSSSGELLIDNDPAPRLKIANLASGARDLDVSVRTVLGPGSYTYLTADHDGYPSCAKPACAETWNTSTHRYETSHQSLESLDSQGRVQSDWETMVKTFPFLKAPTGLPVAEPPAACDYKVTFEDRVGASDAIVLAMDRSGSMRASSSKWNREVCGNRRDDDRDGQVDEADCVQARLEYVKAAARSFLAVSEPFGHSIGLVSFNEQASLDEPVKLAAGTHRQALLTGIAKLQAGGNTAIGEALSRSGAALISLPTQPAAPVVYLMTDGYNNTGRDPVAALTSLRKSGVRVHTIPAGDDVDVRQLRYFARQTGGYYSAAPHFNELHSVYAELAIRQGGNSLLVPRVNFAVAETPDRFVEEIRPRETITPAFHQTLQVERGARKLLLFLGVRNPSPSTWNVRIEVDGPHGEHLTPASTLSASDLYFTILAVSSPAPGSWRLTVLPDGPELQQGTLVAYVDNDAPQLFGELEPTVLSRGETATLRVLPGYVSDLHEKRVSLEALLTAPDGRRSSFSIAPRRTLPWNPPDWLAEIGPLSQLGVYRLDVRASVDAGAELAPSEPIFSDPDPPPFDIPPFHRALGFSITVADGRPTCIDPDDCDGDGIPDGPELELCETIDMDNDGRPNHLDEDSDNDDLPDALEYLDDTNSNDVPDFCEPAPRDPAGEVLVLREELERLAPFEEEVLTPICSGVETDLVAVRLGRRIEAWERLTGRDHGLGPQREKVLRTLITEVHAAESELHALVVRGRAACAEAERIARYVAERLIRMGELAEGGSP